MFPADFTRRLHALRSPISSFRYVVLLECERRVTPPVCCQHACGVGWGWPAAACSRWGRGWLAHGLVGQWCATGGRRWSWAGASGSTWMMARGPGAWGAHSWAAALLPGGSVLLQQRLPAVPAHGLGCLIPGEVLPAPCHPALQD